MSTLKELHGVTGRCACGQVTFACSVECETALCSCDICRRSSGSAFQAWVNGSRASLLIVGETGSWASTTHADRRFCPGCGSSLFLFEQDEVDVVEVAVGTINAPDGISSSRMSRAYRPKLPLWGHATGDTQ